MGSPSKNSMWLMVVALGATLACGDKGGRPDAAPPPPPPAPGTISMAWHFVDGDTALDQNPCQTLGAVAVSVVATPIDAIQGATWSFDCSDLQGTSPELGEATYDLRIEVLGTGLRVLGDPVIEKGVAVTSGEDTSVGPVEFDLSQRGTVVFHIDSGETAGNCADVASGGAGITSFRIDLTDLFNECRNATVQIENPNAAGGFDTFVADCGADTRVVLTGDSDCIENDMKVTIPDAASGPVRLVIVGYQADQPCYRRFSQFSILGGDTELDLGDSVLSRDTTTGTCAFPAD